MMAFATGYPLGLANGDRDEIFVFLIGPRGGTRAIESFSPDGARALRDSLTEALKKFEGVEATPRPTEEQPK